MIINVLNICELHKIILIYKIFIYLIKGNYLIMRLTNVVFLEFLNIFHTLTLILRMRVKKIPRFPGAKSLHFTFIREGIISVIPDDDVIQDINIKHKAAIPEFPGQFAVGFTGLDVP